MSSHYGRTDTATTADFPELARIAQLVNPFEVPDMTEEELIEGMEFSSSQLKLIQRVIATNAQDLTKVSDIADDKTALVQRSYCRGAIEQLQYLLELHNSRVEHRQKENLRNANVANQLNQE